MKKQVIKRVNLSIVDYSDTVKHFGFFNFRAQVSHNCRPIQAIKEWMGENPKIKGNQG